MSFQRERAQSRWQLITIAAAIVFLLAFTGFSLFTALSSSTFHTAVDCGDVSSARTWLSLRPALVHSQDQWGAQPLHLAIEHNDLEMVRLLMSCGADVNFDCHDSGLPLNLAADRGVGEDGQEIIEVLIGAGADIDAQSINSPSYSRGGTPLHFAALRLKQGIVRVLLDANARVDVTDADGLTPLHHTMVHTREGHSERHAIAEMLLSAGADLNARDKDGRTPLWYLDNGFEHLKPDAQSEVRNMRAFLVLQGATK